MLRLYNTALFPLRAAVGLWAALRRRSPSGRVEWSERLGRGLQDGPTGAVWIHGASVGEARIVTAFARELRRQAPDLALLVSALTPTGRAALPAPPEVDAAAFAPLDFPGAVRGWLDRLRPAALVLVETELWPNQLQGTLVRGIPVVIVNGRLSSRSMARYLRLRRLFRPLLHDVAALGAQSDVDAGRFLELGARAERVEVTGNLKYDLPTPEGDPHDRRQRLGLDPRRPVIVAASTGEAEEAPVLEAFAAVGSALSRPLLVLAPRHLARTDEVEQLVRSRGMECVRFSRLDRRQEPEEVLLVDTLGDLPSLFLVADLAFVGGSLVPVGGHNLLEPASCGIPVLFGPHVDNVAEPARALLDAGGGLQVGDARELGEALTALLQDTSRRREIGRRAETVVRRNQGALSRSVELLLGVLREARLDAAGRVRPSG